MQTDYEPQLAALFTKLQTAATVNFTGDTVAGNATITNVSSTVGLYTGLPVFGPGVAQLAVIDSFDSVSVTLNQPIATGQGGLGLSFSSGFQLVSRRRQWWTNIIERQPALFLSKTGVETAYNNIIFPTITIKADIIIFSRAGEDPDAVPDVALNALCNLVRSTIATRDDFAMNENTLGGLCQWCRVEGEEDYDDGAEDQQSKAVIPVRIFMPTFAPATGPSGFLLTEDGGFLEMEDGGKTILE